MIISIYGLSNVTVAVNARMVDDQGKLTMFKRIVETKNGRAKIVKETQALERHYA